MAISRVGRGRFGPPPLVFCLLPSSADGLLDPEEARLKRASSLVAPALLLPLAAALALVRRPPDSLATLVDAAPVVVFAVGAFLGLVTRRARLVFGLAVLALADCALVNLGGRATFDAVALLLPLNLAVIAWLGEEKPLTGRGAVLLGIALLQAAAVAVLQRPEMADLAQSLEQPVVATNLGVWTALPQLSLFAFLAALTVVLARFLIDRRPPVAAAAWALVASFIALDGARSGGLPSAHLAAAGLMLVLGASSEAPSFAYLDDVTGLPTNFELNKVLRRLPRRYALARVEIDEFIAFRQTHGPEAARRMLRLVADALRKVGAGGRPFYCGVQTFVVVFRRTSAKLAARRLDAVRRAVQDATLDLSVTERGRGGKSATAVAVERTVSVTISAGIAHADKGGADPYEVMLAAERALDRAREAGMNRVCT